MPSVRPKGEKRAMKKKGDITDFDHMLTGKEQKINACWKIGCPHL